MAKKRSSGEGTVYKDKKGRWVGQVCIDIDANTGKLKRKTFYGKTKKEVLNKINAIKHELQQGNYLEPSEIILADWLNNWLEGRKHTLKESTFTVYETIIKNHISPHLGDVKIRDLTTRQVQNLLNTKFETGRMDGSGGLSVRTVKYIYQTLNSAVKQAIRERLLHHNIVEAAELPRTAKSEMKTLHQKDIPFFLKEAEKSPHYAAFVLALVSGLRRGELLGLTWDDVDWEKSCIFIKKQLIRRKSGLVFSSLKTSKSYRTVYLDSIIMDIIKEHQGKQEEIREMHRDNTRNNVIYNDMDLLFCTDDGKPLDPDNFARHFKILLKRANIPDIRFHDLRHTYATLSLEAGISLKAIQESLGHSSISITGDIYSHVTENMKNEAAKKIGSIIIKSKDTNEDDKI